MEEEDVAREAKKLHEEGESFRCCLSNWWIKDWFRSTSRKTSTRVACRAGDNVERQASNEKWGYTLENPSCTTNSVSWCLKDNPQVLKFYTGIPEWTIFMALLNLLYPAITDTPTCKLRKLSMVLMFLMQIQLNLLYLPVIPLQSLQRRTWAW